MLDGACEVRFGKNGIFRVLTQLFALELYSPVKVSGRQAVQSVSQRNADTSRSGWQLLCGYDKDKYHAAAFLRA